MIINKVISPEEQKYLEQNGVVFKDGQPPYFQMKERSATKGTMRLRLSGRIVRREPLDECLEW